MSYLFKTDVKRRVHFYSGVGANYGITLKSVIDVYQSTYKSVYYYNENQNPSEDDYYPYYGYDNGSFSDNSTSTNLSKPMQFVNFFIPTGLSLKLSKKPGAFFNNVNLYTEFNPGVEIQIIAGDKTYTNPFIGVALIGINYHW